MRALPSVVANWHLTIMAELAAGTPKGCFVEVGVYKGGSALELYAVAKQQGRDLHLFDTFTGIPVKDLIDRHEIGDFCDADLDAIRKEMPEAVIHAGQYPDTHPEDLKDIAFIHCDCDQYQSYRAVIDRMYPLLVPGGILLFDDYPYLAGAKKAVDESFPPGFLRETGRSRFYVLKI